MNAMRLSSISVKTVSIETEFVVIYHYIEGTCCLQYKQITEGMTIYLQNMTKSIDLQSSLFEDLSQELLAI